MTTLDILIPHYEDIEGLTLSLESISNQTWGGACRIVVCDDGSSSHTRDLLNSIIQQHSNVVLIQNEKNLGRARTRNVLLDSIESPYTAWLDAGDEWYEDKLKVQFDAIYRAMYVQRDRPVWVTCNYDWQWNFGRKKERMQDVQGDQIKNLLLGKSLRSYLWTILAESDNIKNVGYFDEPLPRLQDLDYFLRFVDRGGRLISPDVKSPQCVYHKSDIGRDAKQVKQCYYYIYDKHSHVYAKFRPAFRRNRKYDIELHAARFAKNNNDEITMYGSILKAALINPGRFVSSLVKNKRVML